jgi:hypothetical protein
MRIFRGMLVAALGVVTILSLQSQPGGGVAEGKVYDVTPLFDAVDTNHDGKITKEEWKAAGFPDQPFDMWDPGKKGYLTKDVFGSFKHPAAMDTNNDGKLTREKMLSYIKKQHVSGATEGNSHGGGEQPQH